MTDPSCVTHTRCRNNYFRLFDKINQFRIITCNGCLEGPSAIAISKEDATAPARILCEFAKGADKLELKGGVVEGTVYDVAALSELAKIPSREVLLSRLLGSMQSPITNFARVIKQIAEKDGEAVAETAEAPAEEAAETTAE